MPTQTIEQLARALAETLPEGVRALRSDLEKNFSAVLASGISRLDLVTREEFEVQAAVLRRTREKLASLEARLADLEAAPSAGQAKKPASGKKAAKKKSARKKSAERQPAGRKKAATKTSGKKAAKKKTG